MRKLNQKFYGASLVALAFSLNVANANAQTCTPAPSCDTLGFTKSATDCKDRTSLKCPFDQSKYFCLTAKEEEDALGGTTGDCEVGTILYSDKTCSAEVIPSKVAIGIVFDKERSLAMALEDRGVKWGEPLYSGVPELRVLTHKNAALADYEGKTNTAKVVKFCKVNGKSCPAFEYVSSYQTEGTNAGDWYLPALGELNEINKNVSILNAAFERLSNVTSTVSAVMNVKLANYWSSSQGSVNGGYAWFLPCHGGDEANVYLMDRDGRYARPVLAF